MPELVELYRWCHCRVQLLSDRDRTRRGTSIENVPAACAWTEVDPIGWTKKRPSLDGVAAG